MPHREAHTFNEKKGLLPIRIHTPKGFLKHRLPYAEVLTVCKAMAYFAQGERAHPFTEKSEKSPLTHILTPECAVSIYIKYYSQRITLIGWE